jgi:hypothetical protein
MVGAEPLAGVGAEVDGNGGLDMRRGGVSSKVKSGSAWPGRKG